MTLLRVVFAVLVVGFVIFACDLVWPYNPRGGSGT